MRQQSLEKPRGPAPCTTTRDETTPLVFRDDRLVGWGETAYNDIGSVGTG